MKNNELKRYLQLLLTVVLIMLGVCAVIFLMFRTQTLIDGINYLNAILKPFFYGAAIAYILRPICLFFEQWIIRLFRRFSGRDLSSAVRMLSILLTLVLALTLVILLILMVIPQLISSISGLILQLPDVVTDFQNWLQTMDRGKTSHEAVTYITQIITTLSSRLQTYLETSLLPNMKTVISEVTSSFLNLFDIIKDFGLGCIVAAYFLGSWEKFIAQAKLLVYSIFPQKIADWIRDEVHFSDRMFSGFINGKIIDSLIIGVICFVFTQVTQMPYALLVSIIVGVTNVVPFFGPYLGAIPSAILILIVSPYQCVVFLIFVIILQQFDGNILGPYILGDRVGVSGFWVLFSILFFGSLWGLVGMLVGVPVFAVLYDLICRLILLGLRWRNRTDLIDLYIEKFVPPKKPTEKKRPEFHLPFKVKKTK